MSTIVQVLIAITGLACAGLFLMGLFDEIGYRRCMLWTGIGVVLLLLAFVAVGSWHIATR